MKPRSKIHHVILALAKQMPDLTKEQKQYALKHCLKHIAYKQKNGKTSCLDCGHIWNEAKEFMNVKNTNCPSCGEKLKVEITKMQKLDQRAFFGIIDVIEEFQVNRFFEIYTYHKAGEKPKIYIREVVSQWMRPDHKPEVISRARGGMGGHDCFHGYLEIRDRYYLDNKSDIYAQAYWPKMKVLPIYKRNGFKKSFHGLTPYLMFSKILTDTTLETLLKAKQYSLMNMQIDRRWAVNRFWDTIKICMRNRYIVKDGRSYLDYLDLLVKFKKDIRNPKFVCPDNFEKAHQFYVKKQQAIDDAYNERRRRQAEADRIIREQKNKLKLLKSTLKYKRRIAPYAHLTLMSAGILINPLLTVEQFKEEGKILNHCIYTNGYYNEEESLLLSVRVDGVVTETVEVSLKKFIILQARGRNNQPSELNAAIRKVVEQNMSKIRKIALAVKKQNKAAASSEMQNTSHVAHAA